MDWGAFPLALALTTSSTLTPPDQPARLSISIGPSLTNLRADNVADAPARVLREQTTLSARTVRIGISAFREFDGFASELEAEAERGSASVTGPAPVQAHSGRCAAARAAARFLRDAGEPEAGYAGVGVELFWRAGSWSVERGGAAAHRVATRAWGLGPSVVYCADGSVGSLWGVTGSVLPFVVADVIGPTHGLARPGASPPPPFLSGSSDGDQLLAWEARVEAYLAFEVAAGWTLRLEASAGADGAKHLSRRGDDDVTHALVATRLRAAAALERRM